MISKRKTKPRRGFTLIETLIAVLILATAVAGPLTIASKGLQSALIAKDQTTAYYLAQDAVEYVRYARDTNTLRGSDWLDSNAGSPWTNLTPCESADGSAACYFDSLSNSPTVPTACEDRTCSLHPLYYNANKHYFNYDTNNTRTIFTRSVSIQNPVGSSNDEASL